MTAATVRLLISDLTVPQIFSDSELEAFLTLEGQDVKLAAAQALDAIASNETLVLKRITTLDLTTDGPAVAKSLREHADALRLQVARAAEVAADAAGGEFEFTTTLGTWQGRQAAAEISTGSVDQDVLIDGGTL